MKSPLSYLPLLLPFLVACTGPRPVAPDLYPHAGVKVCWTDPGPDGRGGALNLDLPGGRTLGCRIRLDRGGRAVPFRFALAGQDGEGDRILVTSRTRRDDRGAATRHLTLRHRGGERATIHLVGRVALSDQALPVETRHGAQERFALVRNVDGLSSNTRNNALYERAGDWLLLCRPGPEAVVDVAPLESTEGGRVYRLAAEGASLDLALKTHYYRKHRNLTFFDPSAYRVWRPSVSGWCSWWPYRARFSEKELKQVLAVFKAKRLNEFGYRYIQIDDTFQRGGGGKPADWLVWNGKFPAGIEGYVEAVREAGFEPGIWIGAMFHDKALVGRRPELFIPGRDGKPLKAPWLGWGLDPTVPETVETLIRPTFRGLKEQGFTYVKIDTLRHLLYDCMYRNREHFGRRGTTVEGAFRRYLGTAREELGRDTFVLACWGVLPEAVGIADGCRLGTDRFGPAKLQQYNSFNGIVWRNDADHCDILPAQGGDRIDTIIRPALVAMSGSMLMVSDKAEVYRDDRNLEGMKRSAPVPFTVPGQVYDVDPVTSDNLVKGLRPDTGAGPGPIDARHDRPVCPWWSLEIDRPFERWTVLSRFNFDAGTTLPEHRVVLAELGLRQAATGVHVHEFWSGTYLGCHREAFTAAAIQGKGVRTYALRAARPHPWVLSTSRHLTMGGPDLVDLQWDPARLVLRGRSKVVARDQYEIVLVVPPGFVPTGMTWDGSRGSINTHGDLPRLCLESAQSGVVDWAVRFGRR